MTSNLRWGQYWIGAIGLAAIMLGVLTLRREALFPKDVSISVGVLVAALLAQFSEKHPRDVHGLYGVPAVVTGALAAALILPPGILTPLIFLLALPVGRRGHWHWLAAAAPAALAAHLVAIYLGWSDFHPPVSMLDGITLCGAALLFPATFMALRGAAWLMIGFPAIEARSPAVLALIATDALYAVLGVAAAGIWFTDPPLLLLAFPALILIRWLSNSSQLAALADTDPKTGLPNVRYFEREAAVALERDATSGKSTSLLFLDLDYFKSVNDTYGHAAGDHVLAEAGQVFALTLRRRDIVARAGGEEFVALLPETDAANAVTVAEEVRAVIAAHPFVLPDGKIVRCTASIGAASAPRDGTTLTLLLAQADRAMYGAKETRNSVRQAHTLAESFRPLTPATEVFTSRRIARGWTMALAPVVQWITVLGGGAAVCAAIYGVTHAEDWALLPIFAALAVFTSLFPIALYRANGETHSFSFTLAVGMAAIAVQPWLAPLVHLVAAAVHIIRRRQRQWDKVLFNLASPTLAAAFAAMVFMLLRPASTGFTITHAIAAAAAALTYSVVNHTAVALMVSLYGRRPLPDVLGQMWVIVPVELLVGIVGSFVGTVYTAVGIVGAVLFVLPLMLMYVVLSTSATKNQQAIEALASAKARVETANAAQEATVSHLIETLSAVIDARDQQVSGHSRNVACYASIIAAELGLSADAVAQVHTAGLLHDLGKLSVPEAILQKPTKLDEDEFASVKAHPSVGKRILSDTPLLVPVANMVGDHHERWDGTGYPRGLKGEAISLGGRIVAVADALDSIVANRVYSRGKPLVWALQEIAQCAGAQFDPRVVAALQHAVESRGVDAFLTMPTLTHLATSVPALSRPVVGRR